MKGHPLGNEILLWHFSNILCGVWNIYSYEELGHWHKTLHSYLRKVTITFQFIIHKGQLSVRHLIG